MTTLRRTTLPRAGPAVIERPVIIAALPRTGSTMLFDALAQSPVAFTIGGESHTVIEGIPCLQPANRGYHSNRLTANDATPDVIRELHRRFVVRLRNRDGRRAVGNVRLIEKTPKNALRVPFLDAVFRDAFYIYLYRDPRENISSMLDGWRARRFVTYHLLPNWTGLPWSLLLVPGWQKLNGRPLAEIVARQWTIATTILLDDLESLAPSRWCTTSYERIVRDPQREIERLCALAGLPWDRKLSAPLPVSSSALTPPDPAKITRNLADLEAADAIIAEAAARARSHLTASS
jgi:sulfotransferase family protein